MFLFFPYDDVIHFIYIFKTLSHTRILGVVPILGTSLTLHDGRRGKPSLLSRHESGLQLAVHHKDKDAPGLSARLKGGDRLDEFLGATPWEATLRP